MNNRSELLAIRTVNLAAQFTRENPAELIARCVRLKLRLKSSEAVENAIRQAKLTDSVKKLTDSTARSLDQLRSNHE